MLKDLAIALGLVRQLLLSRHLLYWHCSFRTRGFFDITFVVTLLSILLLDQYPVHFELIFKRHVLNALTYLKQVLVVQNLVSELGVIFHVAFKMAESPVELSRIDALINFVLVLRVDLQHLFVLYLEDFWVCVDNRVLGTSYVSILFGVTRDRFFIFLASQPAEPPSLLLRCWLRANCVCLYWIRFYIIFHFRLFTVLLTESPEGKCL